MAMDITINGVKHTEDVEEIDKIGVEDMKHLHEQHKIKIYLRLAVKLPHSLVEVRNTEIPPKPY